MRHWPTSILLDGLKGLEIGRGSWNDYELDALNVSPSELEATQHMPTPIDIDAFGDDIPVADESQDFVFSSHVVEHLPNLIKALKEWDRVVKVGGYIVMIVPLPDARVKDRGKELTTWEHIKTDYDWNLDIDSHPFNSLTDYRGGHYHTFTPDSLMQFIGNTGLKWQLVGIERKDTRHGNGFWLAYRKEQP